MCFYFGTFTCQCLFPVVLISIPIFQVSPALSCKNHYSAGLTSSGTYYLKVSGQSFQVRKFIMPGIFFRLMLSVHFVQNGCPFPRGVLELLTSLLDHTKQEDNIKEACSCVYCAARPGRGRA